MKVSPASGSAALRSPTTVPPVAVSETVLFERLTSVGASLKGVTVIVSVFVTLRPVPPVSVTVTSTL